MAGKWKEYRKKKAADKVRYLELKKAAKQAGNVWTGPVPKSFRKSGGVIRKKTGGHVVDSYDY